MVFQVRLELVSDTLPELLFLTVTKKSSELKRALLRITLAHIGTGVTVGEAVFVAVLDGVGVLVGVRVFVGVLVGEGVNVLVGVGVSEGTTNPPPGGFGFHAAFVILAMRKDSLIPER